MLPLLLIPLYAVADAYAGGSFLHSVSRKIPGRAVFWAAIILAVAGYLLCGLFGALCALGWFIWRTPGWKVFGGSATPSSAVEALGTLARHMIATPLLMLSAYWTGHDVFTAAIGGALFALAATLLACWYEDRVHKAVVEVRPIGDENTWVETLRGAAFGLVVAVTGVI